MVPAAFALFSMYFWTAGLGWGWHIARGRFIAFEGTNVRVPWDMISVSSDDGKAILMVRHLAPYDLFRSPAGSIFVSRGEIATQKWPTTFDHLVPVYEKPPNGSHLVHVSKLEFPQRKITCWEFSSTESTFVTIECLSENDALSASLYGSEKYRIVLYETLETVSK